MHVEVCFLLAFVCFEAAFRLWSLVWRWRAALTALRPHLSGLCSRKPSQKSEVPEYKMTKTSYILIYLNVGIIYSYSTYKINAVNYLCHIPLYFSLCIFDLKQKDYSIRKCRNYIAFRHLQIHSLSTETFSTFSHWS